MLKSKVSFRNPLPFGSKTTCKVVLLLIKKALAFFISKARVSALLKPWVEFYKVELTLRFRSETLYFSFAKILGGCKFH